MRESFREGFVRGVAYAVCLWAAGVVALFTFVGVVALTDAIGRLL